LWHPWHIASHSEDQENIGGTHTKVVGDLFAFCQLPHALLVVFVDVSDPFFVEMHWSSFKGIPLFWAKSPTVKANSLSISLTGMCELLIKSQFNPLSQNS
jgi:hypothetical protein